MDARLIAALGCLTIGVADWIYLGSQVLPSVVGAGSGGPVMEVAAIGPSPVSALPGAVRQSQPDPPAVEQPDVGAVTTIHFDSGSAALDAAGRAAIDRLTVRLQGDPSLIVRIEGHADLRGEVTDNQLLGQQRANAVADHMVEGGIAFERLALRSFGESRPRAIGDDDEAHRQNRRVELHVARGDQSFQRGRR